MQLQLQRLLRGLERGVVLLVLLRRLRLLERLDLALLQVVRVLLLLHVLLLRCVQVLVCCLLLQRVLRLLQRGPCSARRVVRRSLRT